MRTCATCRHWTPFEPGSDSDGDRYCALASTVNGDDPGALWAGGPAVAWSVKGNTAYLSTEPEFACNQHSFGNGERRGE